MQYLQLEILLDRFSRAHKKKKKLHLSVTELETSPGGKKLFWNRARDNKS